MEKEENHTSLPPWLGSRAFNSAIHDVVSYIDVATFLKPCQILIEYGHSGAVITAHTEKGDRIRDYFSAKIDRSGLRKVDTLIEVTRFLSKITNWEEKDTDYSMYVGKVPRTEDMMRKMNEDLKDTINLEDMEKLHKKGYTLVKIWED